jgi:hypothetical protein
LLVCNWFETVLGWVCAEGIVGLQFKIVSELIFEHGLNFDLFKSIFFALFEKSYLCCFVRASDHIPALGWDTE